MVKAKFKRTAETKSSTTRLPLLRLLSALIVLALLSIGVIYQRIILEFANASQELIDPLLETIEIHKPAWNALSHHTTKETNGVVTIGYFVSITGCDSDKLAEGAAVLKHSIHLASIHGDLGGKYDYKMHAIYHPDAASCVAPLADLGYQLEQRDVAVQVKDIEGDFLRSRIEANGCCGSKELIKLEAYTFTQYPIVVHLDLDFLLLKPLDSLFDVMLPNNNAADPFSKIQRMWPEASMPTKINAFFTRDYYVVNWNIRFKAVQGGFLVLRPDKAVYDEFIDIFRKGDFREGLGWGGTGVGPFYGAMTVQGLLPYYYDILHPGETVDLNPCNYNLMAGNPRDQPMKDGKYQGRCRSGQPEEICEDCRLQQLQNIESVHYTHCQKPWFCLPYRHDLIDHRICRKVVGEWYRIRSSMERSWGRSGMGPGNWDQRDFFFGYCTDKDKAGYVPVALPYGQNSRYGS